MRDFTILRTTRDEEPEHDYAVLGRLALTGIGMIPAARKAGAAFQPNQPKYKGSLAL